MRPLPANVTVIVPCWSVRHTTAPVSAIVSRVAWDS
jgi:hypothetical protein